MAGSATVHPLRKIVDDRWPARTETGLEYTRTLLECGHTLSQAGDMYGDTYPQRRRCFKCTRGMPQEVGQEASDYAQERAAAAFEDFILEERWHLAGWAGEGEGFPETVAFEAFAE